MSKNDKERRISYDPEDWDKVQHLLNQNVFKNLELSDFFAICMVCGK